MTWRTSVLAGAAALVAVTAAGTIAVTSGPNASRMSPTQALWGPLAQGDGGQPKARNPRRSGGFAHRGARI